MHVRETRSLNFSGVDVFCLLGCLRAVDVCLQSNLFPFLLFCFVLTFVLPALYSIHTTNFALIQRPVRSKGMKPITPETFLSSHLLLIITRSIIQPLFFYQKIRRVRWRRLHHCSGPYPAAWHVDDRLGGGGGSVHHRRPRLFDTRQGRENLRLKKEERKKEKLIRRCFALLFDSIRFDSRR